MNYKRVYDEIINNRIFDKLDKDSVNIEKHHIVPKCIGGSDEESNIVSLTLREHFLCHLLLTKIYNDKSTVVYHKLLKAFFMMFSYSKHNDTRHVKINSKVYERLKLDWIGSMKLAQSGGNNSQYGSRWINDGVFDKKIKNDESLPEGFVYGRININLAENIKKYSDYHKVYKDVGFEEFVKITGYNKSMSNLLKHFDIYVKEFIPQSGIKRGFKKES